ncbi:MAG: hypothetical protein WAW45_06870 [Atribacterota bacterium]
MNKKIFSIVLIIGFIVLLTGCAPAPPTPPTPPPTPTTYTIKVISACAACWGNVYVNGVPSGQYLPPYGAAVIPGVPAGAAIRLEDELGWVGSNIQFFYPPNTNIVFEYF